MKIIIPMSGFGERFRAAGYDIPKPLINVQNKPMIGHIVDMFDVASDDFIFICNEDHIQNKKFKMIDTIIKFCPKAKIVSIKPHKLGPVHALLQVNDLVDDDEEIVVNYADFTCYWDWALFKKHIQKSNIDASIVAYKGFHPHSLGKTNYAYMKIKDGFVYDIQEKQPFTNNRMDEYAASGTFYFRKASDYKKALSYTVDKNLTVGGEYYLSLSYKYYFENSKKVSVYPLQHFMQWGTPEDVSEYNYWSSLFDSISDSSRDKEYFNHKNLIYDGSKIILAAGAGKRFHDFSEKPKPFIEVSGRPMMFQSSASLPKFRNTYFSLLQEDVKHLNNMTLINSGLIKIKSLTQGQAKTANESFKQIKSKHQNNSFILFGSCDNALVYSQDDLKSYIDKVDFDILVFGAKSYPSAIRDPNQYGWIIADDGYQIREVLVKKEPDNVDQTPIVTGSFLFKNESVFNDVMMDYLNSTDTVNKEYYLDSSINTAIKKGYKCVFYNADYFICWGTPNDLKTFEYWQSCFHKWNAHKYSIENDRYFNNQELSSYINRIYNFNDNPYSL